MGPTVTMTDISMCLNKQCESRTTCYRFTAIPNEYRQSYSDFQPVDGEDKCGEYMPISVTKGDNNGLA